MPNIKCHFNCRLYACLGLDSSVQDDLLTSPDSTNGSPTGGPGVRTQKKIHQVSQSANPLKITIKNLQGGASTHEPKPSRKRRQKEFASPNSDSRILVTSHDTEPVSGSSVRVTKASNSSLERPGTSGKSSQDSASNSDAAKTDSDKSGLPMCSVTISFDLNTQKLWDDLHLPYETYTSFFRHLILLEKYFRNGDLVLSENASQKSQSYIKSLQNRIEEFEVKHKRSHADLSAVTRPDLSVPAGYSLLGPGPPIIDPHPPTTRHNKTSAAVESAPSKSHSKKHHDNTQDGSTILRIPKVSMPSTTNTAHTVTSSVHQAAMPNTLRVRKDLMFLGLMANPPVAAANPIPIPSPKASGGLASLQPEQKSSIMIEAQKQQHQQASKQLEEMLNQASHQASKAASNSANSATVASGNLLRQQISGLSSNPPHQNLMQLLNDPTLKQKSAKGPVLGKTSLVAANSHLAASGISVASTGTTSKSSNSQLFKNSDSSSGSSAIPLTFNNSIAEVLAAAAKSKSREASSVGSNQTSNFGPTKTSEVTITAKSFNKTTASWTSNSTSTLTSSSGSSKKHHQFGKPMNQSGKVNPLLEMRNFLSHQAPGIPPHIVAQNTLTAASSLPTKPTISTHQMAGTMPKIAPKPSGSLLKPIPVPKPSGAGIGGGSTIGSSGSSKSSGGITSVNKKSLNTVLDRLSGFKSTPSLGNMSGGSVIQQQPQTGSATSSNFRQTATSSPSSLVQQLQAPPIMTNPSMGSPTKNHNRVPSSPNIPTVVGPASMRPQPADGGQGQSSTGSSTSNASKLQSLQTLMAQQGLLSSMAGYPGASASGLVGQPMVQYPWSNTGAPSATSSAQQATALAEAQRALAMAGMNSGLPGMNSAAANAALTEIFKLSLQAQQAKGGQKTGNQQTTGSGSNSGQQAPRIRAPPPLTHMGRQGGGGNQSSQAPNKPHKQPE